MTQPITPRKVVGIDLGTTFCAVAHIDPYGKPQIIPNGESERLTPSVILFDGGSVIVGSLAKNNAVAEAERIVADVEIAYWAVAGWNAGFWKPVFRRLEAPARRESCCRGFRCSKCRCSPRFSMACCFPLF